ncbi:hypothetical protein HHI36_008224 [Cryptolaemus montrouzieri]|uniref:Secreted protein n=1 Tax=Cryptolaemus montrouzieri TaxID=559131 RepID=A0ABD2MRW5_9CUCU
MLVKSANVVMFLLFILLICESLVECIPLKQQTRSTTKKPNHPRLGDVPETKCQEGNVRDSSGKCTRAFSSRDANEGKRSLGGGRRGQP